MKLKFNLHIFIIISLFFNFPHFSFASDKMMIVIIDGARYSETFGDPTHSYIPKMWELSKQGTLVKNFYNDSLTFTSRAIPALWCGSWTDVQDTVFSGFQTQYTSKPTIFEYYRKEKNVPAEECFYVLKYISSLWLPSFNSIYGPDYWPKYHSQGATDEDVAIQAQMIMDNYHPHFLWIYLADVDGAGHSGDWIQYTRAIQKADSIVVLLWEKLQSDPFYKNNTVMFVTNDHGRHDDQHGGFRGHGDDCEGCKHIQFLAVGPEIKENYVSTTYRRIPDMAVTASKLLGIIPTSATGEIMTEILDISEIKSQDDIPHDFELETNYPNPFNDTTIIKYSLTKLANIQLKVFDSSGQEVKTLINTKQSVGDKFVKWDGRDDFGSKVSSGLFFYTLDDGNRKQSRKMLLIK